MPPPMFTAPSCPWILCFLYFDTSSLQTRLRPFRIDGGRCGKGVPSSGEKIVFVWRWLKLETASALLRPLVLVRWRHRNRRRVATRTSETSPTCLHREVGWHRKQTSRRFGPLNVGHRICSGSKSWIGPRTLQHNLKIRRVPPLGNHLESFLVSDLSGRDGVRGPRPFRNQDIDRLRAQRLVLQQSGCFFFLQVPFHSSREPGGRFGGRSLSISAMLVERRGVCHFVLVIQHDVHAGYRVRNRDHRLWRA